MRNIHITIEPPMKRSLEDLKCHDELDNVALSVHCFLMVFTTLKTLKSLT